MGTPHKHAEVIKAWADGKQIQVYSIHSNRWLDLTNSIPAFNSERYRVKPETVRYRVALFRSSFGDGKLYPVLTKSEEQADEWEKNSKVFIRWITEWQEVET